MEPAVPSDEAARPAAPGHPDRQPHRRNLHLLAYDEHGHRGHPEKKLAFRVNINHTIWSYELEPTDKGTRVTETRHAENGVTAISTHGDQTRLWEVCPVFERELVDGMNATLSRIKASAES